MVSLTDTEVLAALREAPAGQQILADAAAKRRQQRLDAEQGIAAANKREAVELPPLAKKKQASENRVRKLEAELREAKAEHLLLHRTMFAVGHSIDTERAKHEAALLASAKDDLRTFLDKLAVESEKVTDKGSYEVERGTEKVGFSFFSGAVLRDIVVGDNHELLAAKGRAITAAGQEATRLVSTQADYNLDKLLLTIPDHHLPKKARA